VWKRRQKQYPQITALYDSKLTIAQQQLQHWLVQHPNDKRAVTFDSWFTQPDFCRYLDQTLKLPYVGTLSGTDKVNLKTGQKTLSEFAAQLKEEHLEKLKRGDNPVFQRIQIPYKHTQEVYYSYCNTHRMPGFGKQRLVVNYRQADLSDNPVFYLSNRLVWQAAGITRIRRHRWPVEVYHEEGKAEGLDQYQLRDFSAVQRHITLVAVVYSLLRAAQHDPDLRELLQRQLKIALDGSPPTWRRATQAQSLWCLGLFISTGLTQGQSLQTIMAPLLNAICRV
jgi:hypothetical protein